MRIARTAFVAAGLALGLAGCASNGSLTAEPGVSGSAGASGGASTGPQGSPSAGASAAGVANRCVVGTWKSTEFTSTIDAGGAHGTVSGGSGVTVTIAPSGSADIGFDGMQPVTFDSTVGTAKVSGQFVYGGKVDGAVQVPESATSTGVWKPVGTADWRTLTVTVDMTSPVRARPFDHVKIGDFASAGNGQTGGSVDLQPILREGTYECSGSTLKLGPPPGQSGGTWVLQRQ
ncbi:hypothetical protein HC031_10670 [Planosporangium thailandense]|uniref:Lipoprotein n=1 Tax=Planosporangium thailandense TaxID=765197 RepID=A0ABX0XVU1_9ACTN|nr:hypothetical protein [Planosporangium thailandense]NJC70168.1 hypothetical protein [Planosporangium thailandense]